MEFLDEYDDDRPRFIFRSRAPSYLVADPPTDRQLLSKPLIAAVHVISIVLLALSIFTLEMEPFKSIALWVALSLLIGPFAPISFTGGDVRIGQGPVIEFKDQVVKTEDTKNKKRSNQKRSKPRISEDTGVAYRK